MLSLLGSDKPIVESLNPNPIDQSEALENQFSGMTDIPFSFEDYENTRKQLVKNVNDSLTSEDKDFLISFEEGTPDWSKCSAGDLSKFPSTQWKLKNIERLKETNKKKFNAGTAKLRKFFNRI